MIKFDYNFYHSRITEINRRVTPFWKKSSNYLPVAVVVTEPLGFDQIELTQDKEKILKQQLHDIAFTLKTDTDWLPYLEPWHGVGVYAEAFGCPVYWSKDKAPWTQPIITHPQDVYKLKKKAIKDTKIMRLVLDTIDYFNQETKGRIPIALTDTQSPIDTAILIWKSEDFFIACYNNPKEVHLLLDMITESIIEFSKIQLERIENLARPGHIMWSSKIGRGISLSDDIISIVSPKIYEEFALPYNQRIADVFDGIAIHSCGRWTHNFETIKKLQGLNMIDLAITPDEDNNPLQVKEAFKNTDIVVQTRLGNPWDGWNSHPWGSLQEYFKKYYFPQIRSKSLRLTIKIETTPNLVNENNSYIWLRKKQK